MSIIKFLFGSSEEKKKPEKYIILQVFSNGFMLVQLEDGRKVILNSRGEIEEDREVRTKKH